MFKRIARWLVTAFGVFLILDAIFSLVLGKRYTLWGLEYTPDRSLRNELWSLHVFPQGKELVCRLQDW